MPEMFKCLNVQKVECFVPMLAADQHPKTLMQFCWSGDQQRRKNIIYLISVGFCLLSTLSCANKESKKNLFSVIPVCNGLYREKFIVFSGGAYSAERYSYYLTDSTSFRKYIGTHEEEENFSYRCYGDSVFVEKVSYKIPNHIDILERKDFSSNLLKKEHKFE